jgi:hypothetical protein
LNSFKTSRSGKRCRWTGRGARDGTPALPRRSPDRWRASSWLE